MISSFPGVKFHMLHRETTSVRHFVARVPSASEVFIKVLEYLACTDLILPCFITGEELSAAVLSRFKISVMPLCFFQVYVVVFSFLFNGFHLLLLLLW